jgi:hypothetical protein
MLNQCTLIRCSSIFPIFSPIFPIFFLLFSVQVFGDDQLVPTLELAGYRRLGAKRKVKLQEARAAGDDANHDWMETSKINTTKKHPEFECYDIFFGYRIL